MSDASSRDGSSSFPCDGREPEEEEEADPLDDEDAFRQCLEKELFNETLAAGIDNEEHIVGRVYEARATAKISTFTYEDGTKKINESEDLSPSWVDQGHYECHTCGMKIDSKAIAFLHASDEAKEMVEDLPPAIRANVSELMSLDDFVLKDSE